ncbi:MAG TPA: DUF4347 domain-containing protein, partial [Desulfobacterales bacterium]|nr:DUF4347 domain-containing protein [Desulfobacterales bacterium]
MKQKSLPLVLEQLEDRIFLDANPLVVTDGVHDPAADPTAEVPVEVAVEPVAVEPEKTEQQPESEADDSAVSEEQVASVDEVQSTEESEQDNPVAGQDNEISSESASDTESQDEKVELQNEDDTEAQEDTLVSTETGGVDGSGDGIKQVVFVDSSVADYDTLLDGIVEDISAGNTTDTEDNDALSYNEIQIVTLDADQDEFQQITDALSNFTNLDGVHIISHGANSSIRLGNTTLDSGNLDEYASQLNQWGEAFAADGDLLLYGCNVAEDGTGAQFIEAVSELTGADVAASDDATGNADSGGDWDLEVATGDIDVDVLSDASGEWAGLLAPPDPIAGGSVTDTQPMLNSVIGFSVTFDNDENSDDADEGYWPYVDIVVPS